MRYAKTIRNTLLGGVLVALAACSSAGGAGGGGDTPAGGGSGLAVRVVNDMVPPASVTIWMVPETGSRRRLGTLSPNATETFRFNPAIDAMDHRLVATVSGGSDITSNPFVPAGYTSVEWSISSIIVRTNR